MMDTHSQNVGRIGLTGKPRGPIYFHIFTGIQTAQSNMSLLDANICRRAIDR
jgi:hypothetical protein